MSVNSLYHWNSPRGKKEERDDGAAEGLFFPDRKKQNQRDDLATNANLFQPQKRKRGGEKKKKGFRL